MCKQKETNCTKWGAFISIDVWVRGRVRVRVGVRVRVRVRVRVTG